VYAGLRVTSELVVPEWRAFETAKPFDDPDVVICLDREPPAEDLPILSAEQYHFQIDGVGAYHVDAGREIRIAMQPGAGARETRLFLLGSAWGALCYQRGILVLHSSVVLVRGQAVAFCGASGGGKSSAVAWLAAHGYPLFGDDLCRFDVDGKAPRVYPAAPRLKLWRDALTHLGWRGGDLERDHFRMDKFHVPADVAGSFVAPQAIASPLPLRAVYLLAWGELGITRLTGLAALRQLIESATYRGDLLEPMGQIAAHWQRCSTMVHRVPVFKFSRPFDWSAMDASMRQLIAGWGCVTLV
jgi:hypothetical protein